MFLPQRSFLSFRKPTRLIRHACAICFILSKCLGSQSKMDENWKGYWRGFRVEFKLSGTTLNKPLVVHGPKTSVVFSNLSFLWHLKLCRKEYGKHQLFSSSPGLFLPFSVPLSPLPPPILRWGGRGQLPSALTRCKRVTGRHLLTPGFKSTETGRKTAEQSVSCPSLSYFSDSLQKDGFYPSNYCLWVVFFFPVVALELLMSQNLPSRSQ